MKINWMNLARLCCQVNVFVAIALVVLLSTGCSNPSKSIEKIKIVRVSIPDDLLITCPKPTLSGEKASDIAVYAVKVTDQLKICNSRITQIKNLVKDYEHEIEQDLSSDDRDGLNHHVNDKRGGRDRGESMGRGRGEPRDRGEPRGRER